jgi:nicotinamidase/pyrazinamidase
MEVIRIDPSADMLGVIDVQPTFMAGGELPVTDGEAVVRPINRLLQGPFIHAFATQDWHPSQHISFASTHGRQNFEAIDLPYGKQTLWPDHAVQATGGAQLHPELLQARIAVVVRKGYHDHTDSYSAFFENDRVTRTGLDGWLRDRGVRRLFLCGLATDFCVGWSAEDARRLGYETFVIEDASRGIGLPVPGGGTTMDASRRDLAALGVRFIAAGDLR